MNKNLIITILLPFLGTTLGSACVFVMRNELKVNTRKILAGFAAGVMVAASIWSLLIPAIEQSEKMGKLSFIPAFAGFWIGTLFLLLLDKVVPHTHIDSTDEGPSTTLKKTTKLVLAVTLHNIPEGMAVGVVCAGWLRNNGSINMLGALALSIGIAIQNFPEGAIVSMPLKSEGMSKKRPLLWVHYREL